MANRNAKIRKYSDFILNLFYFVSVYFVSIIYDYANNYINEYKIPEEEKAIILANKINGKNN